VLHDQAYEQAVDITYRSHFDYSAGNRPLAMVGNVARVVLLFKSFAQNMVYLLTRQALLAAKGDKEARKAFAGLLLSHAMGAGVLGLPVVGTLLGAASLLGSSDDEPWDAQVALRNLLADALGQKPAEVLARGVSRLTPWDISGRVGLDRLLMPDVREGLEGARLAEAWLASAAGPVAGIGVGALKGLQLIGDGHYHRGIEEMLPLSIRGPVRSVRFAKEGAVDKTGIPIVDETTVFEELGQALGFSPSRVREAFEGKSAIFQADRRLNQRRQALMTAYAQASKAEDQEALEAIRDEIRGFNDKNPARKITQQNLLQSLRMREKRLTEAEQGLYLPKKRRDVQDAGRFAQP
jgi:hypothetical protein